ncbi:MAG: flavin reductase family protein [Candidatus Thermoplasmatota archaeon]|nr:flavin reductase family protein [Candidatus Thermoplasmatota archaeon]
MNAHKEEYGDFRKRDPDEYSTGSGNEDHMDVKPNVLYFGTPVVLISSLDKEGNVNLSPMSSAWALGYNVILGLSTVGKTYENLNETGELTLNFPDRDLLKSVETLAPLTGKNPVPPSKADRYRYESDKFKAADLTAVSSDIVHPPLVKECPIQMEAVVKSIHALCQEEVSAVIVEATVVKVHASKNLVLDNEHIDPVKWKPLIYSFRHYFSLGEQLGKSFKSET